jgi:hypothetical protein
MIGVVCKPGQTAIAGEFFELFKTPWEFHVPGRSYEVIIATSDLLTDVDSKLLIVYGAEQKRDDPGRGFTVQSRHRGGQIDFAGAAVPIYSEVAVFREGDRAKALIEGTLGIAGVRAVPARHRSIIRLGYDLFEEVRYLLSMGQPVEYAHIPTLDLHIDMLRGWILNEGISFLEVMPAPASYPFTVCLTHDIDFVGIRNHKFDHTMWGFLYRSTLGGVRDFFKGRISSGRLLKMWHAAVSLPLVFLGWVEDFWEPFSWYLRVEEDLPATYFLIPFKRRTGERVPGSTASRRATTYDITDLSQEAATLLNEGCEIGVHGIDSWHSVARGRKELARVMAVTGKAEIGIRMHWLLRDEETFRVLEEAGYAYDSTAGYNEAIGYRNGTSQVFQPLAAKELLELPLHIQDGALFYPQRLNLAEPEAWRRCASLIANANQSGGVLTLLWHDRSHGPERFWGEFYERLVQELKSLGVWFASGAQIVQWFRKRRQIRFERVETKDGATGIRLIYEGDKVSPAFNIRFHRPADNVVEQNLNGCFRSSVFDQAWNGRPEREVDDSLLRSLNIQ